MSIHSDTPQVLLELLHLKGPLPNFPVKLYMYINCPFFLGVCTNEGKLLQVQSLLWYKVGRDHISLDTHTPCRIRSWAGIHSPVFSWHHCQLKIIMRKQSLVPDTVLWTCISLQTRTRLFQTLKIRHARHCLCGCKNTISIINDVCIKNHSSSSYLVSLS